MRFTGITTRSAEIGLALVFAAGAAVTIGDSLRIGVGWGDDGPRSGYFPFWIGIILLAASMWQLVAALGIPRRLVFASRHELGRVASVLIPLVVQVAAMPFIGLYLSSAALIAWFMIRLGAFSRAVSVATGVAVAVVTFVVFETWFLVSLPKGPVETWLGY